MRLPFPVRVPFRGACIFASLLLVVQLLEGTAPLFALCSFLFILVATAAFNLAGGFSRTSGAYVFAYSMLAVIVGLCVKAIVGEPADSNLLAPQLTILIFLGGICSMYVAVFISRKLTPRKGILQDLVNDNNLQNATAGCVVMGLATHTLLLFAPRTSGSFTTALAQVDRFLPMAIILGTIHQIRKSGGTRSVNLAVLLSGGTIFYTGLVGFSKEGMFAPLVCWVVAACSQNYRISRTQAVCVIAGLALMFTFLVPYSQIGRNYKPTEETHMAHIETSIALLSRLGEVRQEYQAVESERAEGRGYFNVEVGFFDRLQMISTDDELIHTTVQSGPFGPLPLILGFQNLVPHFIWPDKPIPIGGNFYAHQIGGILPEEDETTGISFSPMGEAYHLMEWTGIFFVAPALWVALFTLFDSLCGDTRVAPWGLLMVVYYAHMAPEGMLGGIIYALGFVSFGIVIAALSAAYVMPILGTLIKGPERRIVRKIAPIRSIPRRVRQLPAPETGQ